MIMQEKTTQPDLQAVIDLILVSAGIFFGAIVATASLWLWFNYQADPAHSYLAALSANVVAALPAGLRQSLGLQANLMGLPFAAETSAYWYMARAGGVVAYLLFWLSTVWGLTLSTKVTNGFVPAPLAYGLHEFLSILGVVFAAVHAVVLLGDHYINFNLLHLLVPFVAPYKPVATGLGTVGLYLAIAMTGSFYIRKQIGQKTWRKLHYLTFVAYILTIVHGLTAGTDSALGLMKVMYAGTGFSVLFLIYYRLITLKPKPQRKRVAAK